MIFYYVLLVTYLFVSSVSLEEVSDMTISQLLDLASDIFEVRVGDVKSDDVTLFLFTRSANNPLIISGETKDVINLGKPTKFIIHGWIDNNRRNWNKKLTEEFLKREDCNVIQVNWERLARTSYFSATKDTKLIGQKLAQFIIDVNMHPGGIHLIGHSLGAHIAGFAGKEIMNATGEKIARITGLDPAGPLFRKYVSVKEERLDKDDARVVDIIHTDGGGYGIEFPVGTFDIFVNGGRAFQPSCLGERVASLGNLIEYAYCSHSMSTTYFTEWINIGKFRCAMCTTWQRFSENDCNETIVLREEDVNKNITGICHAKTYAREPYLRD